MSVLEAFFFGMMVAWTPSLILIAWMLLHGAVSRDQVSDMQP
jgi:hypothetical protein